MKRNVFLAIFFFVGLNTGLWQAQAASPTSDADDKLYKDYDSKDKPGDFLTKDDWFGNPQKTRKQLEEENRKAQLAAEKKQADEERKRKKAEAKKEQAQGDADKTKGEKGNRIDTAAFKTGLSKNLVKSDALTTKNKMKKRAQDYPEENKKKSPQPSPEKNPKQNPDYPITPDRETNLPGNFIVNQENPTDDQQ